MGSSGAVFLITWVGGSRNVTCVGYLSLPVIFQSWLLTVCLCVVLTLSWLTVWINHDHSVYADDHVKQSNVFLSRVQCLPSSPFGCATCEANWNHALILYEFHQWVCWCWSLWGSTLVQINVRHCLWLPLGNLFRDEKLSNVCGCLCCPGCV